jgi:peroxiredoxin
MLDLGIEAPEFDLPDTISNRFFSFNDCRGTKGTLIIFMCNHCPYVVHVIAQIVAIAEVYMAKGIGVAAISSNDVENYPQDSPENMKIFASEYSMQFPYLYDASQSVAHAYDAACTPDFYLFDENNLLVYRGRMDSSRPGNNIPNDGKDLRNALDRMLAGDGIIEKQYPSGGCNIKWLK